jgi:hypothetical protein
VDECLNEERHWKQQPLKLLSSGKEVTETSKIYTIEKNEGRPKTGGLNMMVLSEKFSNNSHCDFTIRGFKIVATSEIGGRYFICGG